MTRLLLLAAAIAIGQFANSMVLPALPLVARDLGVEPGHAGLAVTVYFAGFATFGMLIGPASDRIGRRPLLLGGLAVLAIGSMACAWAPSFGALLAFRLLEAAGAAGTPVLARAIVRDTSRDADLAAALGVLATIMSISPVIGPILGGLVTDALGWRRIFAILAAVAALCAIAVYFAIAESNAAPAAPGSIGIGDQMRRLWSRQRFRRGVLFGASFYFAFGAVYTLTPFVLIGHFHLSHTQFGMAFAVMSIFLAVGGFAGPRLQGTVLGPRLLDLSAAVAIAGGALLLALAATDQERVGTILPALALFGAAFGVALSVGAALTFSDAGAAAGTASAFSGSIQTGAAALGSAVANLLHADTTMPLGFILVLTGGAALLAIRKVADIPVARN